MVLVAAAGLVIGWGALRARASEPASESPSSSGNEVHLTSAQLATLEINIRGDPELSHRGSDGRPL